jgi:hypothetical protein
MSDLPPSDLRHLDEITNLSLVENGLLHTDFELGRAAPSHFRVAREAHLLFYRSMIERLRGSANLPVIARLPKDPQISMVFYRFGDGPWKEVHYSTVSRCRKAWRFSEPAHCPRPNISTSKSAQSPEREHLIHFYDALAMIQTECFMGQPGHSSWRPLPDSEMKDLEWLNECVRNDYEHFVPRSYGAFSQDLLHSASVCLAGSQALLSESNNVLFHDVPPQLRGLLRSVLETIYDHEKRV